jgi:hypothetical protein
LTKEMTIPIVIPGLDPGISLAHLGRWPGQARP